VEADEDAIQRDPRKKTRFIVHEKFVFSIGTADDATNDQALDVSVGGCSPEKAGFNYRRGGAGGGAGCGAGCGAGWVGLV